MIRLYIDPAIIDGRVDHVINWVVGWLYRHGYTFHAEEYDYRDGWSVEIYTKGLELVDDIFEFVVNGFGNAFRYFVDELDVDIEAVAVCSNEGCVDVRFEDLKRLEEQEHLEVEERWQRLIEPMVYGEDDDPEYIEYKEAIRWERLVGIRNDGDMLDAVLEQEDYE